MKIELNETAGWTISGIGIMTLIVTIVLVVQHSKVQQLDIATKHGYEQRTLKGTSLAHWVVAETEENSHETQ